jgi:hypothetical protein
LTKAAAPFRGATAVVAVVDAPAARSSPRSLLRALYAARPPGAGHFAAALLPAAAPPPPAQGAAAAAAGHVTSALGHADTAAADVSAPVARSGAALEQLVASEVAALLGAGAPPLGVDEPLMGAGVNSTLAVALTGRLEERLGVALPPTLVSRRVWGCRWALPNPVNYVSRLLCLPVSGHCARCAWGLGLTSVPVWM